MSLDFDPRNAFHDLESEVASLDNEITLDPKSSALIVVDMQVDYCSPQGVFAKQLGVDVSPNSEIANNLEAFAQRFREAGSPVIFTRMIEIPEIMPENLARKINSYPKPLRLCDPNTEGFDYYGITPQEGDLEVIKNTYNAFLLPEHQEILDANQIETPLLRDILDQHHIQTAVFTGVLTARCVQTSLHGAVHQGFDCVVPFDLVSMPAGPLQLRHLSAIAEMATLFAEVTRSSKISFSSDD